MKMFLGIKRVFALLIANHIESCKEDVKNMANLLKNINIKTKEEYDCNPQTVLLNFIKGKDFCSDDLLIIHYSGHGRIVGRQINDKMEMISTWLSGDGKSNIFSNDIDFILSNVNCRILLISDSCHSGRFGDFYTGKFPYIFIGSSSITNLSKDYSFNKEKKTGILINLFEYILEKQDITELTFPLLQKYAIDFYQKYMIKTKPTLKYII